VRVLHVAFAATDQSGVHRKLAEQVTALRAHGAQVDSVVFADTRVAPAPVDAPYRLVDVPGGGFDQASRIAAIDQCLAVARDGRADVVYMRYPVYESEVLRFVREAPPVVFELQTIYAHEAPPTLAKVEAAWAARVLPHTAGLVAVTSQILDDERLRARQALPGRDLPGHVMPNGADPDRIPFVAPSLARGRVDLLCVANFYAWHGIDRLIVGFASEPDVGDVHLHLVGDGPALPALRELVATAGLQSRVHFHGPVASHALGPWYAQAHLAIGCLAAHRKGLTEVSALKHREYALSGLPMIIGGGDADFPTTLPWLRQFPADDSPISPRVLRAMALGWSHDARRRQIRQWAEQHVTWEAKMPPLLTFLETCAARAERSSFASTR
jgi:glycosyltransferase involved in cell wall biosynthesis